MHVYQSPSGSCVTARAAGVQSGHGLAGRLWLGVSHRLQSRWQPGSQWPRRSHVGRFCLQLPHSLVSGLNVQLTVGWRHWFAACAPPTAWEWSSFRVASKQGGL